MKQKIKISDEKNELKQLRLAVFIFAGSLLTFTLLASIGQNLSYASEESSSLKSFKQTSSIRDFT